MLFNSLHFLVFFPIVVCLYYLVPSRFRWALLLAASYYFYMSWKAEYALLVVASTLIAYMGGLLIARTPDKARKRHILTGALGILVAILFVFKYFNFFTANLSSLLNLLQVDYSIPALSVLLPVGISFYTFQKISYLVDVYRGHVPAEKDLGIFALYSCFFPQLVAGPIERAGHLLPQFKKEHRFVTDDFFKGLKWILWGMFLKVVIADRVAIIVNQVYNNLEEYTGLPLWIASYAFSIQLYADFAGYSVIALGAAKVLGFDIIDNFKQPYLSRNISDFWNRWHISLTNWIQDYVFMPVYMSLSRRRRLRTLSPGARHKVVFVAAVLISQVLFGLWHGAGWNFVAFGIYFGVVIVSFHFIKDYWNRMHGMFQTILNFHVVTVVFVFFRSSSLSDGLYIFSHLVTNASYLVTGLSDPAFTANLVGIIRSLGISQYELMTTLGLLSFAVAVEVFQKYEALRSCFSDKPVWQRWAVYYAMIFSIIIFGLRDEQQFIYFQF